MTLLLTVLGGMAVVAGLILTVAAARGTVPGRAAASGRGAAPLGRLRARLRRLDRREAVRASASVVLAVMLTWSTGWPLLLVVVPLAGVGLPRLLGSPPQTDIELLQALDRWIRILNATLTTGRSITDALRASGRQAPPLLAGPLTLLVQRLDDRWPPDQALLALADELDSADADAVIASLVLSVRRGGTGSTVTLAALADSLQDRLKALREIEAERAKPRIVVRQVTIITLVVLGGALLTGREFFAPYGSGVGQVILAGLVSTYVGALVFLRRLTLPRRRARILRPLT